MVGGGTVIGRQRDADAHAGIDVLTIDLDRIGDDIDQPARERGGRLRAGMALQDREFVAAKPRDGVALAHRDANALRDDPEQLVADRMAERVVDALEVVEVEIEHRHRLAVRFHAREPFRHFLAQQHAIGQLRQRIVARHVRDVLLGAVALGDVLVDRDPAALAHRLMRDLDDAAVGKILGEGPGGGVEGPS